MKYMKTMTNCSHQKGSADLQVNPPSSTILTSTDSAVVVIIKVCPGIWRWCRRFRLLFLFDDDDGLILSCPKKNNVLQKFTHGPQSWLLVNNIVMVTEEDEEEVSVWEHPGSL